MGRTSSALAARLAELSAAGATGNAGREIEERQRALDALEDRLRQVGDRRQPAA